MTPNEQIARWLNLIVTSSLNLGKVFMSNKLYPLTEGSYEAKKKAIALLRPKKEKANNTGWHSLD